MDDFRLRVFIAAAKSLSFTRCAEQLYISQPAVSKHIGELESRYKAQLFERHGSRLVLTDAGRTLLAYAERITDEYRKLQYEMSLKTDREGGRLRLGASSTIAQYLLPRVLARFTVRFPDVRVSLISGNSQQIEQALARHDIDLGLVESASHHQGLHYMKFVPDELVLVADAAGAYGRCEEVTLDELRRMPLVLREQGSGTLEVIARYLADRGIRLSALRVVMQLGSTESIKSFILNSDTVAIVSVMSVFEELRSGKMRVIEIEGCTIERDFSFVRLDGQTDALADRFIEFARNTLQRKTPTVEAGVRIRHFPCAGFGDPVAEVSAVTRGRDTGSFANPFLRKRKLHRESAGVFTTRLIYLMLRVGIQDIS